jgi:hypothetical protein
MLPSLAFGVGRGFDTLISPKNTGYCSNDLKFPPSCPRYFCSLRSLINKPRKFLNILDFSSQSVKFPLFAQSFLIAVLNVRILP